LFNLIIFYNNNRLINLNSMLQSQHNFVMYKFMNRALKFSLYLYISVIAEYLELYCILKVFDI